MDHQHLKLCTAFEGFQCIASGELAQVVLKTKAIQKKGAKAAVLIFDDATGETIDVDFHGTPEDVLKRVTAGTLDKVSANSENEVPRGPGRPKLGVVAREVTLLPRHWDWLNNQPGGASVALRKLVEEARRRNTTRDRIRQAQEAAYRFMTALAGDLPGFEEALRGLFAGDRPRFDQMVERWPCDVRDHAKKLAAGAFQP
jgi:hypothetical protein